MWSIRMRVLNASGVPEKVSYGEKFGTLEELKLFLETKTFDALIKGKELVSIVFKFEG